MRRKTRRANKDADANESPVVFFSICEAIRFLVRVAQATETTETVINDLKKHTTEIWMYYLLHRLSDGNAFLMDGKTSPRPNHSSTHEHARALTSTRHRRHHRQHR